MALMMIIWSYIWWPCWSCYSGDDDKDGVMAITTIIILVIANTMTLYDVDDNVRSSRLIGGRELWGRDVTPTQGLPNILMGFFSYLFLVDTHKHSRGKKKYFHFCVWHFQSTTIHLTDRPGASLTGKNHFQCVQVAFLNIFRKGNNDLYWTAFLIKYSDASFDIFSK